MPLKDSNFRGLFRKRHQESETDRAQGLRKPRQDPSEPRQDLHGPRETVFPAALISHRICSDRASLTRLDYVRRKRR